MPIASRTLRLTVVLIAAAILLALIFAGLHIQRTRAALPAARYSSDLPVSLAPNWYLVSFVGNYNVDLKWTPTDNPDRLGYAILRDGSDEIAFLDPDEDFYRDYDVKPGETHTYQLLDVRETGEIPVYSSDWVQVGQVQGTLYQDLTWEKGVYTLTGNVNLEPGITLYLGPGASVGAIDDDGFGYGIYAYGPLKLEGAEMRGANPFRIIIQDPGSSAIDSQLAGWFQIHANMEFRNNTINSMVDVRDDAQVVFEQNRLIGVLYLYDTTQATLNENVIDGGSVRIGEYATATVANNTFRNCNECLSIGGANEARVRHNRFYGSGSYFSAVTVSSDNPGLIEENIFRGPEDWNKEAYAIELNPGASILIRKNIITGWNAGIYVNDAHPQIIANRITQNYGSTASYWGGISVTGDQNVVIQENCLAGQRTGPALSIRNQSQTVNAENNWWGDESGPRHPDNPDGTGDFIYGEPVDFDPWITEEDQAECGLTDFSFLGMEVVQTVQQLDNSVPLVAGKPTLVRAYPDAGAGVEYNVPIQLKVFRGETLLDTLQPWLPISTVESTGNANLLRLDLRNSFNVQLPAEMLTGSLTLVAEINPDRTIEELSYANNTLTETILFHDKQAFKIGYVPIVYHEGGLTDATITSTLPAMHAFLSQVFPLARVDYTILPHLDWYKEMGTNDAVEDAHANQLLATLTSLGAHYRDPVPLSQVFGAFPPGSYLSFCISDPPWLVDTATGSSGAGLATYCDQGAEFLAHEIGHNLGLRHPNTPDGCGAWDDGTDWPYPDATLQDGLGFNFNSGKLVPGSNQDLMGYCAPPQWISPFHYEKLFNALPAPPEPALKASSTQAYLLAQGTVYSPTGASLAPFWQIESETPLELPAGQGGAYCLELRDSADSTLSSRCFDLDFYNYEAQRALDQDTFVVAVPLNGAISRAVLTYNGAVLLARTASAHAPVAAWVTPASGASLNGIAPVSWTAGDLDGDELAYTLLYSPDNGATWLPVASNLTGTHSYDLDTGYLAGSSSARLRLLVSDGFHTTQTDSPSFTIGDKSPVASLQAPASGAIITASHLTLSGSAYDLEDGELEGAALEWHSDVDGALGTGSTVWGVVLSPGEHRITLTATDSQGQATTAMVDISVEEAIAGLSAANDGPTSLGEPTLLSASVASGTHVQYAWEFGDGESGIGSQTSHIYPDPGVYTATVTASNALNDLQASTLVTILPANPANKEVYLPMLRK